MSQAVTSILACLPLATAAAIVPYLQQACNILKEINAIIQHVKGVRARLNTLVSCVDILVRRLHEAHCSTITLSPETKSGLQDLLRLLEDVRESAQDFAKRGFLRIAFMWSDAHSIIRDYHGRVVSTAAALHIDIHLANQHLLISHEKARAHDHSDIIEHMKALESNQEKLVEEIHEANQHFGVLITTQMLREKLSGGDLEHSNPRLSTHVTERYPTSDEPYRFPQPERGAQSGHKYETMPDPVPYTSDDRDIPEAGAHFESELPVPTDDLVLVTPIAKEPAEMKAGEKKEKESDEITTDHSPAPPAYLAIGPNHRIAAEFNFVGIATEAWGWNIPEPEIQPAIHMPVAQIIF